MADQQAAQDRGAAELAAGQIAVLMERRLNAVGTTLSQRLDAAGARVPSDIAAKIRFIETNLNLLMSQPDVRLSNRPVFDRMADDVIAWLTGPIAPPVREAEPEGPPRPRRRPPPPAKIVATGLLILAAMFLIVAIWGITTVG